MIFIAVESCSLNFLKWRNQSAHTSTASEKIYTFAQKTDHLKSSGVHNNIRKLFFNSYFDISLQFYGYLSQQQNMMQDYVRTGTYQRAILQNHTDFKDKVTSQWSSVHDGVIWCDSNADSDNQLHRDVLKCPTSKEKLKTSLDRWRRLKKKKIWVKRAADHVVVMCVFLCTHTQA